MIKFKEDLGNDNTCLEVEKRLTIFLLRNYGNVIIALAEQHKKIFAKVEHFQITVCY